jgi:putative inorganic carbon (hco3(-)) transporter
MRGLILVLAMTGLLSMAVARPMVGVLAFEWISFMNPQQDAWGAGGAGLPWAMLAAVATLIGCLTAAEPKRFPVNSMTILIILFLFLISLSSFFALGPPEMVNPWYDLVFKSFAFLLVVAALLTDQRRINALVWVMVISLGYYGVKGGLFTIVTGGNNHIYGAPNSMIADNNQLGVALLMSLPLMNYLRLRSAHRIVRVGLIIVMLLTLFAVLGTYSRGALIALIAVTALLWWNSKSRLITGAMLAIGLVFAISFMPPNWAHRMDTISGYQQDNSAEARFTIWHEAFGLALARPLTGAGFRSTETPSVLHRFYPDAHVRAVHSIWFEVLSDTGFPTFFVWIGMQIVGFINIRRIRRLVRGDLSHRWAEDFSKMAEVSMVSFLVGGSFLSLAYYDYDFIILVGLSATRTILENRVRATLAVSYASPEAASPAVWRLRKFVR